MIPQRPSDRPHRARVMLLGGILAFGLVPVGSAQAATGAPDSNADTVEIVNLLINERLGSRGEAPDGDYLIVAAETIVLCPPAAREDEDAFSFAATIGEPAVLPEVPESMRRALICEQEGGMLPSARFENGRVVLASEIEAIFSGNGWWEDFYKVFPGSRGYVQFTNPVFSSDRKHALISVSHSCGGLCGTGWLVFLSHEGATWEISSRQMLWIS
jgi:hypothetical protein